METKTVDANGIDKGQFRGRSIFDEDPVYQPKPTSLLLTENDLVNHNNLLNASKNSGSLPNIDLNKVNSLKTESDKLTRSVENDSKALAVYYKPSENEEKEDEEEQDDPPQEGVKFIGLDDDDSICSSNNEDSKDDGPKIPDGGWGWVVVASAFLISTVADGLAFSYGLLHIEFRKHFEESESKTSLIGSLFIAVPLIAGPIMSALVDRYGCRNMTIVGGVASTLGFLFASISNSVDMLCFTFGFLSGLGMGLLYVTAVVSIAYWFEKKRNLAVSLGACGIGFGTIIYSPMTGFFLAHYGWRGTIILLAGTLLNMCVCGAVMKDPEWWIIEQKKQAALNKAKRIPSTASISGRSARSGGNDSVFPGVDEIKSMIKSGESPEYILTKLVTSVAAAENLDATTKKNAETIQQRVNSVIDLPTYLQRQEKLPSEVLELLAANKDIYNIVLENYPSLLGLRSNSEKMLNTEAPPPMPRNKPLTMSMKLKLSKKKPTETKVEMTNDSLLLPPIPENRRAVISPAKPHEKPGGHRQDWFKRQFSSDHSYLKDIKLHRNSIVHRGAMMNISKYRLRASSCPNIYKNSTWSLEDQQERKWYTTATDLFRENFDFALFSEFHFFLMNASTLLLFVWFVVPYFYLIDFMELNGFSQNEGTLMISVIGIASTVGIVVLGWAGDRPGVNVTKTYAVCLIVCGGSIFIYPFLITNKWALIVNSAVFGLSFASSYSYTPSILVELTTLEKFTKAYGLILLSQGIGHLIGPPIAGGLKDMTGVWDASFMSAGVWVIVSGILVGLIPFTKNFRMCGSAPLVSPAPLAPGETRAKPVVH